ncbi:unnamed protein product, partial [Didymodactylos carnosus]
MKYDSLTWRSSKDESDTKPENTATPDSKTNENTGNYGDQDDDDIILDSETYEDLDDYDDQENEKNDQESIMAAVDLQVNKLTPFERFVMTSLQNISRTLVEVKTQTLRNQRTLGVLYELAIEPTLLRILQREHLLSDIMGLETRFFCASDSKNMEKLFFRFARRMKRDYEYRWLKFKNFINLSLKPDKIKVNLMGFGKLENMRTYVVDSPPSFRVPPVERLSYVTHAKGVARQTSFTHAIVIEASTALIDFDENLLQSASIGRMSHMKTVLHKFAELERQL